MSRIKEIVERVFEEVGAESGANDNVRPRSIFPIIGSRKLTQGETFSLKALIAHATYITGVTEKVVEAALVSFLALQSFEEIEAEDYDHSVIFLIDFKGVN